MSYLALYRKYRPTNFDDLVGQNSVSAIIKNEILTDKLTHAYLFSGPRGTGKTSTAKIIAKMINCDNLSKDGIPCEKCSSCLNFNNSSDIVEIDAASNNGVDEIRDLRDKVNFVPTTGKYKIYIIDEVHMLTTQAFNALLKTLEEPPKHAIFILATTEFHKIPATVISRCQKFQFLKFSNEEIVDRLLKISNLEKINVNNDILYEIARLSDGGLRDAINMLDQLSSFTDNINLQDLYTLNGVVSYVELSELLIYIYNNDIISIVNFINKLDKEGKNLDRFINDLLFFLKDLLLLKNSSDYSVEIIEKKEKMLKLLDFYSIDQIYNIIFSLNDLDNKMKSSSFSSILIVTFFVKLSNDFDKKDADLEQSSLKKIKASESIKNNSTNVNNIENKNIMKKNVARRNFDINVKKIRINNSFATASKKSKDEFVNKWKEIHNLIDNKGYNSIIGMIDDIEVLVVGDSNVMFMAKYDSLIDRVYDYIDEFEDLLKFVYNKDYKIVVIAKDEWNYEKNNYVEKIKNGYKYEYINEEIVFNVGTDSLVDDINIVDKDIDKVISLIGEDVVVYK